MIDIYIERCNGCSCSKTVIHLFKGIQADYERREKLITFLKGTKKKKQELKDKHPALYEYFSSIWDIRTRHMVPGLPSQYYILPSVLLIEGVQSSSLSKWYVGGPPLTFSPLPVPDSSHPFGDVSCTQCSGVCSGHYLKPDEHLHNMQQVTNLAVKPPSAHMVVICLGLNCKP